MNSFQLPIKFEAIVYTENQSESIKVLALKRSPHEGGFWQPVTGTLESGESLKECLYRELGEEISLRASDVALISDCFYSFTWEREAIVYSEYVFAVKLTHTPEIILSDEHEAYQWVDIENIQEIFEKQNNKKAVLKFKEILFLQAT